MAFRESDIVAAVVVALLLVAFALCVWPGFARVQASDLAGYWAAPGGGMWHVQAEGPRVFRATQGGQAPVFGRVEGVRGLRLGRSAPHRAPDVGHVCLGARRVTWGAGPPWVRQGVAARR